MKKILLITMAVAILALSAAGQDGLNSKGQPVAKNEQNAPVELKRGEKITRGEALVKNTKKVSLEKVFADPAKYADPDRFALLYRLL